MARRLLFLLGLLGSLSAGAQEPVSFPEFDFGGLVFGDAYYLPSNHLPEGDGAAGLVMRRLYLTMDVDFSERWFGRVRWEQNQSGEFETYTFDGDWKDLSLGVNVGRQELIAGLTSTPTFDLIERIWGARYLMRTPMDLQGIASRDTGFYASGPLNASGSLSYRAMWALPVDFGKDSDPDDQVMGALNWKPSPGWTLDFYAAYESRDGPHDRTTAQLFAAYEGKALRWGIQYSNQDRQEDPPLELASAFVVAALDDSSSVIGRIDRLMEPSPKGNDIAYIPFDPSAPATLFLGAWEKRLTPSLTLTPNTIVILYDRNDQDVRPRTDVYLRLTAFWKF